MIQDSGQGWKTEYRHAAYGLGWAPFCSSALEAHASGGMAVRHAVLVAASSCASMAELGAIVQFGAFGQEPPKQ